MSIPSDVAIRVSHLSKMYKIYAKPADMFWELMTSKPRYTPFWALDDISFEIKRGQVIGIVGRNGAGKSTLLKILTGTLDKTAGEVAINGRVSSILELGLGFNPNATGRENIYVGGLMMGLSHAEVTRKLDWIVAFSELEPVIDQAFHTYSTGMQARLTFSTAVCIDPDILIVDEVLAVGDAAFQMKCFNKFQEFIDQNNTILLVSHATNIINNFCDTAMLLEHGQMLMFDEPKRVTNRYHRLLFSVDDTATPLPTDVTHEADMVTQDDDEPVSQQSQDESTEIDIATIAPQIDQLLNKTCLRYGTGEAEIVDFGVIDTFGVCKTALQPHATYTFYCRIQLHDTLKNLTIGMRIRTVNGVDVFAANTSYHKIDIPEGKADDIITVMFKVVMHLGLGEYFTTFGVRNTYNEIFYDRYIDAFKITVLAEQTIDASACLANLAEELSVHFEPS